MSRDPYDYTLEVCAVCGAQLDRTGNGRCPVDRSHWRVGGMIVRVVPRADDEQDDSATRRHLRLLDKARTAEQKPTGGEG